MNCDLSIIVPIYNVEKYLEQTLQSLLKQREYSYEIILVDDGSKDKCPEICDQYQKENPGKIQVVHKPNGGLPSARKAGVRAAKGEYVTFLDGDDWIDEDYYYNMLVSAKEHDAQVACSSYRLSYPDRETEVKNYVKTGIYEGGQLEKVKKEILYNPPYYTYGIYPSLCMKLIRKNCLEEYIYAVPDYITIGEDAACSFPLLLACNKLVMLNENTGYHYRQIATSMMNAYDAQRLNKVIAVIEYMESVFAPHYEKYGKQIDMYYTQLIKELVKNELLGDASTADKKEKVNALLEKPYTQRTLQDLRVFPFAYRIFFWLIKSRQFVCLNVVYNLFKKLVKER